MDDENDIDDKPQQGADPSPASGAPAASPTAQDDKPLEAIIGDVIKSHVDAEEEPEPSPEEGKTDENVEQEEPDVAPVKPEEKEQVPFHEHPRWKEVVSERNDLKAKLEETTPLAETARHLQKYCQDHNLSQDELTEALSLAALAKSDVRAFQQKMEERLTDVHVALGNKLPADLQKKVDDGTMDAESAKELATLRLRSKQAEGSAATSQQQIEAQRHQSIATAIDQWESSQKKNDPDWDKRRSALEDRILAKCNAKPPRTVSDGIRIAEEANTEVKKMFQGFIPKPRKRTPLLSSGSSVNNGEDLRLDDMETDLGKIVRSVAGRHR
jgi:hypothetical protein